MNDKPCRDCGITRDQALGKDIEFVKRRNQCKPCYSIWSKQYRDKNKEKRAEYNKKYRSTNLESLRAKDRSVKKKSQRKKTKQVSHVSFIGYLVSSVKQRCKNSSTRRNKNLNFDIDKEYVLELYKAQDGKCAITKILMTHSINDLEQISIDRIDSSKGYEKGNVQLLCRWVNLAKQDNTNAEIIKCFEKLTENGIEPDSL